jgi:hypothetical protein
VLVIIGDRFPRFLVAAVGHKPALRRLGQHAMRKIGPGAVCAADSGGGRGNSAGSAGGPAAAW